ncbi:MAG: hypothetical protein PHE38_03520 [Alishewanella agri]|nr:hypothetical protein [Alishewanella agri]
MKRINIIKLLSSIMVCSLIFPKTNLAGTDPTELPLFSIEQIEYIGAFRLPARDIGEANANWASGVIAYNHRNNSIFFSGHAQYQAIAEFAIPETSKSSIISELKTASVIQEFIRIFKRTEHNPDKQDTITGMYFDYGRLIINTIKYYDAEAKSKDTTIVINNASKLNRTENLKFSKLEFGAKASGWISKVPTEWQEKLKGDLIIGNSNGWPINGRLSIGPSAFSTYSRRIVNSDITGGVISITPLQMYSLNKPLSKDLLNKELDNLLLTELSKASYGFIIPNTTTYFVIGSSGGHKTGVGYKLQRKNGKCSGFCSVDPNDLSNYYWLFDIKDWIAVLNGEKEPFQVKPYSYGEFNTPFIHDNKFHAISGASYDEINSILWLSLEKADTSAGKNYNPPLILGYKIINK